MRVINPDQLAGRHILGIKKVSHNRLDIDFNGDTHISIKISGDENKFNTDIHKISNEIHGHIFHSVKAPKPYDASLRAQGNCYFYGIITIETVLEGIVKTHEIYYVNAIRSHNVNIESHADGKKK